MEKKLICMLLALVIAASVCVAAFADDADFTSDMALLEKISEQEQICIEQELPALIKELLDAQQSTVCEYIWYDEAGNRIEDPELIANLLSSMSARDPVTQPTCCDNPSFAHYYSENHLYAPPTPAACRVTVVRYEGCRNCATITARTVEREYTHMHV